MSFVGVREQNIFATCATALTKNKMLLLDKTTGIATYATYGSVPDGYSMQDAQSSATYTGYTVAVNYMRRTQSFFIRLFSAVTKGAALVCTGSGTVAAALHTVTNMHTAATPSPGADAKYIVPAAGWSGDHGNALAVYTHVGTSWAYTEMTADTAGLVVTNTSDGRNYVWSGTAWVEAPVVAYAAAAGVATEDIAAYNTKPMEKLTKLALPTNYGVMFTVTSTSESDSDAACAVADSRILSTDIAIPVSLAAQNAVAIKAVAVSAGAVAVTLTGNGGTATVATLMICRPVAA